MPALTDSEIAALKAQGFHFRATSEGEVQFTPAEEAEWAAERAASIPTLDELKATKTKALADYRWQRTQIMNYDGETDVPADPALSVITSIAVGEQFAPSNGATRTFKLKANVFRTWNVTQIVTYGIAIGNHVQACFNREKALYAQVQAAADESALNAIDITVGWP